MALVHYNEKAVNGSLPSRPRKSKKVNQLIVAGGRDAGIKLMKLYPETMAWAAKLIFIFIVPTSFLIILPIKKLYNQNPDIVKRKIISNGKGGVKCTPGP
jgi:ABC-type uncharacterized transport system permease subunit